MPYQYDLAGGLQLTTSSNFLEEVMGAFSCDDSDELEEYIYPWEIQHGSSMHHAVVWDGKYDKNQDEKLEKIVSLPSVKDVGGYFFYQGEDVGAIGFTHVVNGKVVNTCIDYEKIAVLLSCELGVPNKLPLHSKLLGRD